jgi:hypothetical protein
MLDCLLVERLGVGGGGRDVGVTGGLVGAGGLLESLGSVQVSSTGLGVRVGVLLDVVVDYIGEKGEHC